MHTQSALAQLAPPSSPLAARPLAQFLLVRKSAPALVSLRSPIAVQLERLERVQLAQLGGQRGRDVEVGQRPVPQQVQSTRVNQPAGAKARATGGHAQVPRVDSACSDRAGDPAGRGCLASAANSQCCDPPCTAGDARPGLGVAGVACEQGARRGRWRWQLSPLVLWTAHGFWWAGRAGWTGMAGTPPGSVAKNSVGGTARVQYSQAYYAASDTPPTFQLRSLLVP